MNKPSNSVLLVIFIVIVLLVVIAFFVKTHRYNGNGGLIGGLGEIFTASSSGVTGAGITQFFAKPGKGGGANDDDALSHAGSEYYGGDSDSDDGFGGNGENDFDGFGGDGEEDFGGNGGDGEEDFDAFGDSKDAFGDGEYGTEGMGYIYGAGKSIIISPEIFKFLIGGSIDTVVVPNLSFAKGIKAGDKITIIKAKPADGVDSPRPYRASATVVSKLETTETDFAKIIEEHDSLKIVPNKSGDVLKMMTELFGKFSGKAVNGHIVVHLDNVVPKDGDNSAGVSADKKKTRSKTSTAH